MSKKEFYVCDSPECENMVTNIYDNEGRGWWEIESRSGGTCRIVFLKGRNEKGTSMTDTDNFTKLNFCCRACLDYYLDTLTRPKAGEIERVK
jgi:hypothetical protein